MAASKSPTMLYNYLGDSGLKVSNICLGCMTFGISTVGDNATGNAPSQLSAAQSYALLDKFTERGGNFIDTANVYSGGESEKIVGNWLKNQQRDNIVLATKGRSPMGDGPNNMGLSRKHIMEEVENSLKRLQTDYIDLYQIHAWDNGTPLNETLRTLDDLVRSGKVRYIGASNVTGWQLQKIVERSRDMGLNKWISLQQQYNLLSRQSELEVFDVCRYEGLGVMPWSPLKGGLLTGKFKRNTEAPADTRLGWALTKGIDNQACPSLSRFTKAEYYWNLISKMEDIGTQHGKSIPQVAIRWLLQKDVVASVVVGATRLEQLESNIGAATGWELTADQMAALDEASAYEVPYPYEMVWRRNQPRLRPGQPH